MLVDDGEADLRHIAEVLSGIGHETILAEDASRALVRQDSDPADVIVVDAGEEAESRLAAIRSLVDPDGGAPIVAVVDVIGDDAGMPSLLAGALDVLPRDQVAGPAVRATIHRCLSMVAMARAAEVLGRQNEELQGLATLGRCASGIAHDMSNLLTGILISSDMAMGRLAGHPARENLELMKALARQGVEMTLHLTQVAGGGEQAPRLVNVDETVNRATRMIDRLLGGRFEIMTSTATESSRVRMRPGEMERILTNLLLNSSEAMPQGGVIDVVTWKVDPGDLPVDEVRLPDRPHVVVAVRDRGAGMDPETLARCTEPFFTRKRERGGTGLGLCTVEDLVENAGGSMIVESRPGVGTTVSLYLPLGG